jgi:copper chaperone CopZ
MKVILFGLIGAAALAGAGICELPTPVAAATVATEAGSVAADTSTVRLHIDGMTCGGCAISARVLLERMEGVDDASVDYESRVATVVYDAARVTPQDMIQALHDAFDYTVVVVEPGPDA